MTGPSSKNFLGSDSKSTLSDFSALSYWVLGSIKSCNFIFQLTLLMFLGLRLSGLRSSESKSLKCNRSDLKCPPSLSSGLEGEITIRLSLRNDLCFLIDFTLSYSLASSSSISNSLISFFGYELSIISITLSHKAVLRSKLISSSSFTLKTNL